MRKIYDLRDDRRLVGQIQDATLHTDDYGVISDNGLFGSIEWWQAIARGELPVYSVEGTITDVFMSGHNDYPEFEVDDGNEKSRWTREGDDSEYVVGRRVRIEYVVERPKPRWSTAQDIKLGLGKLDIVLSIWVE